jgi:plasmid stability protein
MSQLVIQNLEDDVRDKLRDLADNHGHSVEEEVRDILRVAVKGVASEAPDLGTRIARRFEGIGLEQDIPELRGHLAEAAKFEP